MVYDAVIVGASIAGLYTGMKLSRAGWKVCIIERRREIGIPVRCGEATGNRLELSRFVEIDESWIAGDIKGMTFHLNDRDPLKIEVKDAGVILHRGRFEKMLAQKAQKSGADILLNTSVMGVARTGNTYKGVLCNNGKEISGKIIIGADGCESKVGRWTGITKSIPIQDAFPAAQYRVKGDFCNDNYLHFFLGSSIIPKGYIWVFSKAKGDISVGAGLYGCSSNTPEVKELLDSFIDKNIPSVEKSNLITGCVPLSVCPKRLVKDNVVIIGDAARQVNPLNAGGIMNTLEAADLAVQSLLANNSNTYSRKWRRAQRRQQRIFYLIKEVFLDCSDKEIDVLVKKMRIDFQRYIDRTKTFTFPMRPLIFLFIVFLPKFVKHLVRYIFPLHYK